MTAAGVEEQEEGESERAARPDVGERDGHEDDGAGKEE